MELAINWWAIVISMIISVVIGFFWYGPLFGKKWMALSGIVMPNEKPSTKMMVRPIIISLIGALFMSYALASILAFHNAFYQVSGYGTAFCTALFLWVGFIVPVYFNFSGWENKSWTLFFINVGYWLVFLLISVAVIVAFA